MTSPLPVGGARIVPARNSETVSAATAPSVKQQPRHARLTVYAWRGCCVGYVQKPASSIGS